jgi:peptidyl-dipeptidase Dcp
LSKHRLLERIHLDFSVPRTAFSRTRHATAKSEQLAELTTRFTQNLLAVEVMWRIAVRPDDLAGLPAAVIASRQAKQLIQRRLSIITLFRRSLIVPF